MNEADVEIIMQEWNSLGLPGVSFITSEEYLGYVCMEREDMIKWLFDIIKRVRFIEQEAQNAD